MAVIATFEKQPVDVLDYDIDYASWLPDNDVISSVQTTVLPIGLEIDTAIVINSGTRIKLWVSGGEAGETYKVEVTVTTSLNRVKQDEVRFRVKEY